MENNVLNTSGIDFSAIDGEVFNELVSFKNTTIERIVSSGHVSSEDWMDQSHFEWVAVIQGEACVIFDTQETFVLKTGDHLSIPPRQKHRVTYTSINPECIWIAVDIK